MNAEPPYLSEPDVLRGFGLRGMVGRQLGVTAFLGTQVAVTVVLSVVNWRNNAGRLQGYANPAIAFQLSLLMAWFFFSRRSDLTRYSVLLSVVAADACLLGAYFLADERGVGAGRPTEGLILSCGLWAVPLGACMNELRSAGLRIVATGESIQNIRPTWRGLSLGLPTAVALYLLSCVLWERTVGGYGAISRTNGMLLILPLVILALADVVFLVGVFAGLAHRHARRWLACLVAIVGLIWFAVVVDLVMHNDISWKRLCRDSAAALLAFVPYLHFLWFRILGYRVAFVAGND